MLYHKMFDIVAVVLFLILVSFNMYTPEETKALSIADMELVTVQKEKCISVVTYYDIPLDLNIQDYVMDECSKRNINPELALAVMSVESDFQYDVISNTNDYGIMQINIVNHQELKETLGINDFLDPYDSIQAGIYMLEQYQWCENETQMLMCYNMGVSGAKQVWNKGIYETSYTRKVMEAKKEIGGKKYEVKIFCN